MTRPAMEGSRARLAFRPTGQWGTRALLFALPLAAVALSLPFYRIFDAVPTARDAWSVMLAAAALYGVSHILRAIRLALLAAPALGMPIRTVALLHFHTAPVSFIVPFKLGELYRWQQLAWLSRDPIGSLVILLLERTLDAVVLLFVLAMLVVVGGRLPPHTELLSALLTLATLLGLFAVFIAPGCLEAMQLYILRHHSAPRARRVLRIVDSTRIMAAGANERLRGNIILLFFLSAAIWALESGMLFVLAERLNRETGGFLTSLLTITLSPQAAEGPAMAITNLYALVCLATLLLVWPAATVLYVMRIRFPRRSVPARQTSLSVHRTRRLHLRTIGKAL